MKWIFRIGDGHNLTKDFMEVFDAPEWFKPSTSLPEDVVDALMMWDTDEERVINSAKVEELENGGLRLIVDAGPEGESDPYGGPWLVASVEPCEENDE